MVDSADPFHWTLDDDTKPLPLIASVKGLLPAVALFGAMLAMAGTRFLKWTSTAATWDDPPPGLGLLTVTWPVPAVATTAAGTVAVSVVLST